MFHVGTAECGDSFKLGAWTSTYNAWCGNTIKDDSWMGWFNERKDDAWMI